jgi:hypothetical protein
MSDIEQMLYKYMDKHGNTISQWKNNDYDYAQTLPENEQMEIVPELVALIQEQVEQAQLNRTNAVKNRLHESHVINRYPTEWTPIVLSETL